MHLQAYERLIRPAVYGVENVLTSALETPTLEKVVLTSSVAAVAGKKGTVPPGFHYTEADWNEVATETYLPYNRSLRLIKKTFIITSKALRHLLKTLTVTSV